MADRRDPQPPTTAAAGDLPGGTLSLVILAEGQAKSFVLPDDGQVLVGRAPDNDVQIDDASISRRHLRLHLGETLTIEDLGSANGTTVRGERVRPNQRISIALNEVVELGSVTVIVQRRTLGRPRRLWSHEYFEARIEDECAQAYRNHTCFGVIRTKADPASQAAPRVIGSILRPGDVIGVYAPGDYECLVLDVLPEQLDEIAGRLARSLERAGVSANIGCAAYPRDGRAAETLIERASAVPRAERGTISLPAQQPEGMPGIHRMVERIAPSNLSVLILGETGSGKEVMAEMIHRLSNRRDEPLLKLNCAALSESLLESELFGHERGAFTGAMQAKPGLLETADGGTVFLDEVGELPMTVQVKLLRVLEERTVLRVGGLKPRSIDIRFLAATNRDLEGEIARGRYRQDLYFRLNGITLFVPPLRERMDELDGLIATILGDVARREQLPGPPEVGPDAMALFRGYSWPGNIRELRNMLERAALLAHGGPIGPAHLPVDKMQTMVMLERPRWTNPIDAPDMPTPQPAMDAPTPRALIDDRPARIRAALERAKGNQGEAAKLLGVTRRTLINWLDRYGFPRPRKSQRL